MILERSLSMWEEEGDSLTQSLNDGGDWRAGPWLRPGLLNRLHFQNHTHVFTLYLA